MHLKMHLQSTHLVWRNVSQSNGDETEKMHPDSVQVKKLPMLDRLFI